MQPRLIATIIVVFACFRTASAAPPVEVEIATERGVQITAPHEWLQLLADMGFQNVRIRQARAGDVPKSENRGTAERPRYRVLGILTARDELRLEGGTFTRGTRASLQDYFDRLSADGAASLTAPRGMFGLTESEIKAAFADLAQPVDFATKGKSPQAVLDKLQAGFAQKLVLDAGTTRALAAAPPVAEEYKGVSAGAALAMLLRREGYTFRPEKARGQAIVYRVEPAAADSLEASDSAGKPSDSNLKHWPIGWDTDRIPADVAPSLFEYLNAEIDGYTLQESLDAIAPRIKLPIFVDQAMLTANKIEPAKIQVRIERTRTSYKRVIDRVLAQAHLTSQIRVDEAGKPFLWITR